MSSFNLFCDGCGIRFEEGQLRSFSKFCSSCGQELSPWIRKMAFNGMPSSSPPVSPTRVVAESIDEEPIRDGGLGVRRGRGGRVRGRGRGRGRGTKSEPATPMPDINRENLGRGMRSSERVNYSISNYYRGAFKKNDGGHMSLSSPTKRRRIDSSNPDGGPVQDGIRAESNETCPDPSKSPTFGGSKTFEELRKALESPGPTFRAPFLARRSRPFRRGTARIASSSPIQPEDGRLHDSLATNSDIPGSSTMEDQVPDDSERPNDKKQNAPDIGDKIQLSAFDLGPEMEVPLEYQEPVPHPGPVKELGILTLRESLHEFIPQRPGQHGILYYDYVDLPKYLNPNDFALLTTNDIPVYSSLWRYLGQYRVVQAFPMSRKQWENISERVKSQKTRHFLVKGEARKWCLKNGIDMRREFRVAVDEGLWKFDCLVIQCIGFDRKLYQRLANMEAPENADDQESSH